MDKVRAEHAAVDARKAEGANCTALLIPIPSECTRSDAGVHVLSLRSMLTISLTSPLCQNNGV